MPSHREGYAQKTTLVGIRVSDDEDPQGHNSPFIIHHSPFINSPFLIKMLYSRLWTRFETTKPAPSNAVGQLVLARRRR